MTHSAHSLGSSHGEKEFCHFIDVKRNVNVVHSYLGNGLYAARLATLGALGADG